MMNTIRNFLKDVISIFSSVPTIRKQVVRTITAKGALELSYAQSVTTSTKHFGRRTVIPLKGDMA